MMDSETENVIWQSKNGTWSRGFFYHDNPDSHDSSDGSDYDFAKFVWVTTGHPTRQEASDAGPYTTPESSYVVNYKGNSQQVKIYDHMALELRDPVAALAYKQYSSNKAAKRGHQTTTCGAETQEGAPCKTLVSAAGRKCKWHRY